MGLKRLVFFQLNKKEPTGLNMPVNSSRSGISLIEILIAVSIFATVFGSIIYMITASINARYEAGKFKQTIILARQKMNDIRNTLEEKEEEGEYQAFPGFKFNYQIKQIEVDILAMAGEFGIFGEKVEEEISKVSDKDALETGGLINLMHYVVKVNYRNNVQYTLDYYKALKFRR